ncbi:hypothetical protein D7X88_06930 [bacterium C-53]|nr:hypothetical protein [Lachnospiraceae bacterium]NBI02954.1 hypothetical protein [Lachnospiraceae bacterium]RKJ10576.1 hypothetical protein D7X88_06930 [bacterium C-53]
MNEMKITIEGLKELTDAIKMLAGIKGAETVGSSIPMPGQVPVQQNPVTASTPPHYGPMSGQPGLPFGQSLPQSGGMMPTGIPTTATTQSYTLEQLQVAAAGLTSAGKMPLILGILQQFGIQAMTELPKERYGEMATVLREAGAQI